MAKRDTFEGITLSRAHEVLAKAYRPWIEGEVPGATCIGDTALALGLVATARREEAERAFRRVVIQGEIEGLGGEEQVK